MVGDRLRQAEMHVSRRKAGKPATHPIRGDELRELRKLRKESTGSFVFVSERGAPFTPASFNWMIKRAGQKAGLPLQIHAHMLRHSAGYKLAGDRHDTRSIQDYLGHEDIRHRSATRPPRCLGIKIFGQLWAECEQGNNCNRMPRDHTVLPCIDRSGPVSGQRPHCQAGFAIRNSQEMTRQVRPSRLPCVVQVRRGPIRGVGVPAVISTTD
jgi:hypothetical protein